jgi:hypothetical protein
VNSRAVRRETPSARSRLAARSILVSADGGTFRNAANAGSSMVGAPSTG